MTRARDVAAYIETVAPPESGVPGDQLGFLYGEPEREVSTVGCLWTIDRRSLLAAGELKCDLLICHERMWMKPQTSDWYDAPAPEAILVNRLREELLRQYGITVYRAHSNWDALPVHGVPDRAVAALELGALRVVDRRKFFAVHELPEPMTMAELLEHARRGLDYSACTLYGDPRQRIRRFSFLIGGFGTNQYYMPQVARAMGAEAILIGEMMEELVMGCLELAMPVIETLHSASEIPAIRRQAEMIAAQFPELAVHYISSGVAPYGVTR